ncbi:MAG TPA: SDR family oxidoreductase [Pyrinomonadaceae bacterium]|jgi:short-subunit dehydrogenase|nr:SDR family oxidoreductase [Pyrinomonadaceae bacterium]
MGTQQLRKLKDQTIVVTGASSGIGLVTARMAAARGARLVLAARSEDALRRLTDELRATGAEAVYVVADVGREEDVRRISDAALRYFGGFDTWVNNAGVSIYGKMLEIPLEDQRRLFETNYWGVVHGSLAAARHLRGRGGAIINVGSTLSDRAIPIQGTYSASKHAVKGFTDALRMELEAEGAPISVTLIKPGAIDTPYPHHAKNYMDAEPTVPPPVYAPEVVASVILYCAEHPERDVFAGGGGKAISMSEKYAPRLTDKLMEWTMTRMQKSDEAPRPLEQNGLDRASGNLEERGGGHTYVAESSLYTKASLHPILTTALLVGAGLALAALWRPAQANGNNREQEVAKG